MNLPDLIKNGDIIDSQAKSYQELYHEIYLQLQKIDYVEDDFLEALLKREEDYPTGIETGTINIALPHVDACHVKQNALFIYRLENKATFVRMDDHSKTVDVQFVFLLLIHDLKLHVKTISELTHIWTNNDIMEGLQFVRNKDELLEMIEAKL